jgi:spore germination protein YaaH
MTRVIDYGLGLCPASKLVPVLKVSGMDWGPSKAEWLSFDEVNSILTRTRPRRRREGDNRVPWFVYSDAGARHTVYYEDADSLTAKANRLRKRGLKNLVLWSLGSEDPDAIPSLGRAQKR